MSLELVAPMKFGRRNYNIVLVGAGGTGGYLANYLAKSLSLINNSNKNVNHCLTIVDGDVVEQKNTVRQNFTHSDVGKYKSEVLSERYGNAYGVEIYYSTEYVATKTKLKQVFKFSQDQIQKKIGYYASEPIPVLVGCVDSHRVRAKVFHEWYHDKASSGKTSSRFWIDCGNEKTNGQVVFSSNLDKYSPKSIDAFNQRVRDFKDLIKRGQQHRAILTLSTPAVTVLHPEILDAAEAKGQVENEMFSCAEVALADPQTMRANLEASMYAYNYIDDLLFDRVITSHASYFSTNGGVTLKLNTHKNLVGYW